MSTIVAAVDLRSLFGPSRNQGPRPTCMAFATSDTHAAVRGGWSPLSCEHAFYHAQKRARRGPDQGALLSSMLETLREDGQPEEAGWPYLAKTPTDFASWKVPSDVGPLFARACQNAQATFAEIVLELNHGHPVIVLIMLSRSFFRPSADAVVRPEPGEMPEPAQRHAVIAVGHGTVGGEVAILVRNSWGAAWGSSGYCWITETFVSPRIFGAAILMEEINVSRRSVAA